MNLSFKKIIKYSKNSKVQLAVIILLGFIFRLYRIGNPLLDWHAFRQADTASVTQRYVDEGINLLQPKYHDLSNIQSGLENPEGYRMVEFPIINGLIAFIIRVLPQADLELTSRFFSILASVGTMIFLYKFVRQLSNHANAVISVAFFSFLPFSIYYSRVVLPEPYLLLFSTASLSLFISYLKTEKIKYWWFSLIFLILSFLLKPFVAFFAPVYLTLILVFNKELLKKISTYLFPIIAIIPFFLWRRWISNFPEGIPASDWLFNSDGIRLRPAWFRWIFWERLTVLIGGFVAPIYTVFNIRKINRDFYILASWWLGFLMYLVLIATGNVRHDYYQVIMLPCISYTFSRGILLMNVFINSYLKKKKVKYRKYISLIICIIIFFITVFLSWIKVRGYFNVNNWEYQKAGVEANLLLPKEAVVIAPANGDTLFLFQTKRSGWPIGYYIPQKIEAGATHYISVNTDKETQELETKFHTIKKTDEFVIIDLTKPRDNK